MFLMIGTTPFGSAITGSLANAFDVRVALQVNASLCLVGLALAVLFLRRARAQRPQAEYADGI
jgi:hypothetical protein